MENASEYEAPRMSIQTKDLIRYNNHITYYKKNHSDFIQKSHYNSTNRQQNPSIYFVRQPEIFSLFKAEEIARRGSIRSCERPFPLLALLPSGHGRTGCCPRCGQSAYCGQAVADSRFRRAFAEGEQLVSLPSATDV